MAVWQQLRIGLHISGAVSVGDGRYLISLPWAGLILDHDGVIETPGTVANSQIQVRNQTQTKDYFSVKPSYVQGSGAPTLVTKGTLASDVSFNADDVLALDVDVAATGASNLHLNLIVEILRTDD